MCSMRTFAAAIQKELVDFHNFYLHKERIIHNSIVPSPIQLKGSIYASCYAVNVSM